MDRAAMVLPRLPRRFFRRVYPLFLDDLTGLLIHAKALVRSLLNHSTLGPAAILHFGHQIGLDPDRPGLRNLVGERTGGAGMFAECLDKLLVNGTGVTGANASGVAEPALSFFSGRSRNWFPVTQQQAADARAIVPLLGAPPADHQFLALDDLYLQPIR